MSKGFTKYLNERYRSLFHYFNKIDPVELGKWMALEQAKDYRIFDKWAFKEEE